MFNWISNTVWQVLVAVVFAIVVGMGIKMWFMDRVIVSLRDDKKTALEKLESVQMQVALGKANEQILEAGIRTQNTAIASIQIDLEKARSQYRIKEKIINRTIFSEREAVRDLNDSEDWNNTKRIVNEIINLKL